MKTLYPDGAAESRASTLAFDFDAPPFPLRISKQERIRLAVARHIDKDPIAYRAKCRERDRQRRASDTIYRECRKHNKAMLAAIKAIKEGAADSYRPSLGYRNRDLKAHMESLFADGMTWTNHGEVWQVDHIKPVSAFVKAGITNHAVIHALENLRPLSCFENNSKHSREAPSVPVYSRKREEYTGEKHHLSKLTEADVRQIKRRLREGKYGIIAQLAREYGVAKNTIQQIKQGKAWKAVE